MCTYLNKTGSTYYFRRAVPAELRPFIRTSTGASRSEWKRTLDTKDLERAKRAVHLLTIATNDEIDAAKLRLEAAEYAQNCPAEAVQRRSEAGDRREAARLEYEEWAADMASADIAASEARQEARAHIVDRFERVPYRGRNMPLTVRHSDAERIEITYRNGFFVDLPAWANGDFDQLVATELKLWLKQRVRRDAQEIAATYAKRFSLSPRSIRVADFASGWGSCGPEGNILINWHLIFAPKKVLEYVVTHELAHLRYRSHSDDFWRYLSTLSPIWPEAEAWLTCNEGTLSAEFLEPGHDKRSPRVTAS